MTLTLTVEPAAFEGANAVDMLKRVREAAQYVDVVKVNTTGLGYVFADQLEQFCGDKVVRFNPATEAARMSPEAERQLVHHGGWDESNQAWDHPSCGQRTGRVSSSWHEVTCPECRMHKVRLEGLTSFTCPRCHRTTYHPVDVRNGYCGNCHDFTRENNP